MEALAGGRGTELVLLHEINAGTFARLYLAEARASGGIDRIVAVKILREQWNEQQEVVARTRDEARLLARLRHKNILRVEELVEVDGQTAIIMEYVDGLDLKQLVEALNQRRQRLPCKVALQIVCEAAAALEAAYFRVPTGLDKPLRVVHRDIQPSNIMVSTEGEVRVLDFGTARSSAVFRSAQTGALRFGSLKYMSPERREGDRGEHPSDVYALGLVLLELLRTEWLPLLPMDVHEHDEAIASAIARVDGLGMPNREWDMALRQALAQMLASDPRARPSAEQVVKLMREFVEQAQGPLMGRFAEEVVAPIAEEHARARPHAGSLAGTRLVVNAIGEGPRSMSISNQGGGAGARPAAQPSAPAAPPLREVQREPAQAREPSRAPARGAPSDDPEPESGNGAAIAVGAGLVIVIALAAVLVVGGGVALWWFTSRRAEAPVVIDAPVAEHTTTTTTATTTPAAATAPVSVRVAGEPAQWIKIQSGGSTVAEARGDLDGSVAPGNYSLTIKIVGRPAVTTDVEVSEAGLALECASDARQNVKCQGGNRALTLKP